MQDKREFIDRDLRPIGMEYAGDFDWDAIADEVGEYDATRGWHFREDIAEDIENLSYSDQLDAIMEAHDLTIPENQPTIRLVLLDKDEERSLYHVYYDIDGDNYETVAVCVYAGNSENPDVPWDWEDKPETLEDCNDIKWTSCEYSLEDPDLPIEARAVIHAIIEQLGE